MTEAAASASGAASERGPARSPSLQKTVAGPWRLYIRLRRACPPRLSRPTHARLCPSLPCPSPSLLNSSRRRRAKPPSFALCLSVIFPPEVVLPSPFPSSPSSLPPISLALPPCLLHSLLAPTSYPALGPTEVGRSPPLSPVPLLARSLPLILKCGSFLDLSGCRESERVGAASSRSGEVGRGASGHAIGSEPVGRPAVRAGCSSRRSAAAR